MATVLIVDDEPMIVAVLKSMLRDHRLLIANNGIEALSVYASYAKQIDLVITDLLMPQMGGYELLKRLRELNPKLKAIAITGFADEYPDSDETTLLHKPFTLSQMRQVVEANLSPRPN